MSGWNDRFKDYGARCIRNFRACRDKAKECDGEVSLALATCHALFVVLDKHFELLPAENNLGITRDELDLLIKPFIHGWDIGTKPLATTAGPRNALAHFNVVLVIRDGSKEIDGLLLESKRGDKHWEGLIAEKDLVPLIDALHARVWPDPPVT